MAYYYDPYYYYYSQHADMQHYPYPGQHTAGIHVYENCMYCGQRLVATTDPRWNYCYFCRRYQPHRV